jgi:phosphoglycerol transferase
MLTVDTHFTDGYKCRLCDDKYDSQYSNVIACADGQVAEFIEWVQGQDFYENTTIVICGDHLTPDSFYVNAQGIGGIDRRTYTAIINPAEGKKYTGEGRVYTTLDMYPTTLSALGYTIEGNRLGLGVDLYSDVPTIVEEKGFDYLNGELMKNSKYYTTKLLYK